jgi:sortase (surface protein transpeptidase)
MVHRLLKAITTGVGRQGALYLLALAAAVGGVIAIVIGVTSQQSAPQPPASAAGHLSPPHGSSTSAAATSAAPSKPQPPSTQPKLSTTADKSISASVPVAIDIPAIDVHSSVISIGKAADGTLAVPQPGPNLNKAAWYKGSVTPGQTGPAVIEGHVDSVYGPSVFFQLGALRPGDRISVTRRDGSVMSFAVNAVRSYATHGAFPTDVVYGGNLAQSSLRLITCSNFDESTGHYIGNTVVFAHLSAVHHAGPANNP